MAVTHRRELRRDPTTGSWVALSEERVLRPVSSSGADGPLAVPASSCPFCPGHEEHTPPTIAAHTDPEGRWNARAFANKFPGVRVEGDVGAWGHGPADGMGGVGAHEVVVECRGHEGPWHRGDPSSLPAGLVLAQARLVDLLRDQRMTTTLWFRNVGAPAGASQSHPHAQLVALPIVPSIHAEMASRASRFQTDRGHDLLGEVVATARASERWLSGGPVVAFCPYAPMSPYEVWLVPGEPEPRFQDADEATVVALAHTMARVLTGYDAVLGPASYNAILYTAPRGHEAGFRWHVRLRPRVSRLAGFELATGGVMHHVFPETAAQRLTAAVMPSR